MRLTDILKPENIKVPLDAKTKTDGPTTYNETYHLVKQNDKWMISDLEIPTPVPATPTRSGT